MASANLVDPNTGDLIPYSGNVTPYVRDSVAPLFSTSIGFNKGSYCYHDGKLYECTTAHLAGAWNPSHFTEVTVGDQLATLKSGLINTWGEGTVTNQGISSAERKTWTRYGNVVVVDLTFTIGSSDISGDTTEIFSGFPAAFANTRFRCPLGYGASQIDLNLAITNEGKIVNQWSIDGIKAGKVYSCSFTYIATP